jgi:hypothetical protein
MNYTNTRDDAVLALIISADVYQSGTGSGTLSQFNVGGSIVIGRRPLDDFHLNSLAEADDGAAVYYLQLP